MRSRREVHILWTILLAIPGCLFHDPSYSQLIDQRFNAWLGKSKDERMRIAGPPERCAPLQSSEEACVWESKGIEGSSVTKFVTVSSWMHQVVFIYDRQGIARAWHYSGSWGERSSGDKGAEGQPRSDTVLP